MLSRLLNPKIPWAVMLPTVPLGFMGITFLAVTAVFVPKLAMALYGLVVLEPEAIPFVVGFLGFIVALMSICGLGVVCMFAVRNGTPQLWYLMGSLLFAPTFVVCLYGYVISDALYTISGGCAFCALALFLPSARRHCCIDGRSLSKVVPVVLFLAALTSTGFVALYEYTQSVRDQVEVFRDRNEVSTR